VDHNDGIYATGVALNLITGESFPYTVKYDTNGKLIFALTEAGDGGVSVAVDPAGKILLSGFTLLHGNPVSTASKLDPSGKQVWVTQIPSSGEIVSDAKGNVFISGGAYTVTKLNPAGTALWTFQASSQFSEFSTTGSVVDPFGNLIVTGTGFDFNAGQNDIITLKFPRISKPQTANSFSAK
jgi:outer membrane protein assembly factor BamB